MRCMNWKNLAWSTTSWLALGCLSLSAAEPTVKELVSGLDNPSGIAIQPETGAVFVTDSASGKILRVTNGDKVAVTPVVEGFPKDIYGKGPMYDIGPLGLGFLSKNELVVGDGSLKDGEELVRVYELPADGSVLNASKMKHSLGPITPREESPKGEGNFYGVAITKSGIYVTSNGDDTKGWLLRSALDKNGQPTTLTTWVATKPLVEVDAPVAITVSPKGKLIVGQMGEMNVPKDSLLTVYDEATGKLEYKAATGLYDITGLAYAPKSGKLYATDFAWMDNKSGGLFRLDVTGDTVTPVKILSLDKPTALAFGADGALYVTVFGTAGEGDKKPGKLLKLTGEF